ncbi:MAG: hypothetical protein A4E71_01323 [Smithella sp. PtaU1.Bin162]|nr:MAG: hypothetical protein A4E71_01323 [Smithella sp. PtaU1.Bin162]
MEDSPGNYLKPITISPILDRYFPIMKHILKKENLEMFLLFTVVFLISGFFSIFGIDGHHDGIMFKPSLDVARGFTLFKDTFNQYGALTIFIQSLAIKIFGEHLLVIKLLTAFFYALTALVIWKIWINLLPRYLVYLILFLYIFLAPYFFWPFSPSSSVYALFFQMFSIYCLCKFLKDENTNYLILSGINASLAFWCKQPIGMFLFLAVTGYFIFTGILEKKFRDLFRNLLYYVIGYLSVFIFMMLIILLSGAIQDWWIQSIEFAYMFLQNNGETGITKIISCLFPTEPENSIFLVMPIISILFFIKILIELIFCDGKLNSKNKVLLVLTVTAMASWLQYYPVACYRHLYWGSIPMIGLVIYFIYSLFIKYNRVVSFSMLIFIVFVIFGKAVNMRIINGYEKITQKHEKYETIRKPDILSGIKVSPDEVLFYKELDSYIRNFLENNPSGYIINLTPDALWVTLGGNRKNLHKMHVNWPGIVKAKYPEWETLVINNRYNSLFLSNTQRDFPHLILIKSLRPAFYSTGAHHLKSLRESMAKQPDYAAFVTSQKLDKINKTPAQTE